MPPQPHLGGNIITAGSPNVKVNGSPAARTGDAALCAPVGLMNTFVTGAATVKINGQLGVREGSIGAHDPGSKLGPASLDVKYGGAAGGATFGDASASTDACDKAAEKGRGGFGKPQGKAMNCGHETVRQLCMQRCLAKGSDAACKFAAMNQDELYRHYLAKYKDQHNAAAEDGTEAYKARLAANKQENDATWKKVQKHDEWSKRSDAGWAQVNSRSLPTFDTRPTASTSWTDVGVPEGKRQTVFTFSKTNHTTVEGQYVIIGTPRRISDDPAKDEKDGLIGTFPSTRDAMLRECGYTGDDSPMPGENSPSGIGQDLANGGVVIAVVDVGRLRGESQDGGRHAVTVSKMSYDENGKLVRVIINDTAPGGGCGVAVSGDVFTRALDSDRRTSVVPEPKR